jgi:large subunit ribosomal protein L15
MQLHELPSIVRRTKKRVGRGTSSGRGKTSGRGVKGDKARGTSPWYKAGGSRRSRIMKHLPQVRGIGNLRTSPDTLTLTLSALNSAYSANDVVNMETLLEKGVVRGLKSGQGVKILAKGKIEKAVKVQIPTSESAKAAIEKAGGSVEQ